jgi:arrestin-related trafficking adapter 3/6
MENTIIQRQWDSQLQYLLSISGRSFYIGGTLPIQIIILPMTNIKVHRIAVILEGMHYALFVRPDCFLT